MWGACVSLGVAVLEKDLLRIEAEQQREEADKGRRDATHKLEETYGKLIALAKVRQGFLQPRTWGCVV